METTFSMKEINDIALLIKARTELYADTKNIRSMFEASKKMYNDDTAFIYELLQNADDCGAKYAKFILKDGKCTFTHDGNCFSLDNIKQITQASSEGNEKEKDDSKIGKFGIGFKSVFNVTDNPIITSGKFKFSIHNYIIPEFLQPNIDVDSTNCNYSYEEKTIIELHIKSNLFDSISERLKKINGRDILFLNSIKKITITTENFENVIDKEDLTSDFDKYMKIYLNRSEYKIVDNHSFIKADSKYYFVVSGDYLENAKYVKIAFQMKHIGNHYEFSVAENSNYNVFFPTNTPTGLGFLLQGKYTVGMNRKELISTSQDFLGNDNNKKIVDTTIDLLLDTIDYLSELNLIANDFFSVLFYGQKSVLEISKYVFHGLKEYFLTRNTFKFADETCDIRKILFADNENIIETIPSNIFGEGLHWVNKKYLGLSSYFKDVINSNYIDIDKIADLINNEPSKVEKINAYDLSKLYIKYKERFPDLKFIKISTGEYVSCNHPYLYTVNEITNLSEISAEINENTGLSFNPCFISESFDKRAVRLLQFQPLTYKSVVEFIEKSFFVEKNNEIKNVQQYFKGFNLILKLMNSSNSNISTENVQLLTKNSKEAGYLKCNKNDVYFIQSSEIANLYIKSKTVSLSKLVDIELYNQNVPSELMEQFNKFIYNSKVKRTFIIEDPMVKHPSDFEFYNKENLKKFNDRPQQEMYTYNCTVYDPTIVGDQNILQFISTTNDIKYSIDLFKLIYEYFEHINSKGWFKYYYKKDIQIYFDELDFITMLKNYEWIYYDNKHYKTSQVSLDKLKEYGYLNFDTDSNKLNYMCRMIGLSDGNASKNFEKVLELIDNMSSNELSEIEFKIKAKLNPDNI